MKYRELVDITPEIEEITRRAITVALEFENLMGRKLGISGSVGEVLVAREFGLRLVKSDIEEGYDAVDRGGKRVQIKVRRSEGGENREIPTNRSPTSRFSKHPYDYALLAVLTRGYGLHQVHRADRHKVEIALRGKRKRILSIGKFKKIGIQVLP